jgi:hypothetical protein
MIFDKVDGTFNEVVFFSTSLKTFNEVVFFSTSLKFQNDMWRPLTHFKATKAKKSASDRIRTCDLLDRQVPAP